MIKYTSVIDSLDQSACGRVYSLAGMINQNKKLQ